MRCPFCGNEVSLGLEVAGRGLAGNKDDLEKLGFTRVEGQVMASGAAVARPGQAWEKRTPARAADVGADVLVPFVTAIVSMAMAWIVGGVTAVVLRDRSWLVVGLVVGVGLAVAVWFVLVFESRRLLWVTERITGADLDGDGHVGRPDHARPRASVQKTIRVELVDGDKTVYVTTGLEEEQCQALARLVLVEGLSFSRRNVTPAAFPTELYSFVIQRLVKGGLLEEYGNGVQLTQAGVEFLEHFLD